MTSLKTKDTQALSDYTNPRETIATLMDTVHALRFRAEGMAKIAREYEDTQTGNSLHGACTSLRTAADYLAQALGYYATEGGRS